MRDKNIVCFVVLHYLNTEDTLECVESILKLEQQVLIRIVIVDNGSPDGSGKILRNKFCDEGRIHVLLRENNDGFSKGNNAGVKVASEKWKPDFFVVTNNDVVFEQQDFINKLRNSYSKYHFDVLGPDIYAPRYEAHQNPMCSEPPSLIQVQTTIIKNTILSIFLPLCYKVVNKRHDKGRRESADDYQQLVRDVCLKGACIVYSRKYIDEREKLFYPETFFYYEEFIQSVYCRRKNKTVIYDPDLSVIHKDGASITKSNKEIYNNCRYILEVTRKSARIYRNYLLRI